MMTSNVSQLIITNIKEKSVKQHQYFQPSTMNLINEPHLPKKGRPRCYAVIGHVLMSAVKTMAKKFSSFKSVTENLAL